MYACYVFVFSSSMLSYGCTRLEIGVQSVYEDVARDTNRYVCACVCVHAHAYMCACMSVVKDAMTRRVVIVIGIDRRCEMS